MHTSPSAAKGVLAQADCSAGFHPCPRIPSHLLPTHLSPFFPHMRCRLCREAIKRGSTHTTTRPPRSSAPQVLPAGSPAQPHAQPAVRPDHHHQHRHHHLPQAHQHQHCTTSGSSSSRSTWVCPRVCFEEVQLGASKGPLRTQDRPHTPHRTLTLCMRQVAPPNWPPLGPCVHSRPHLPPPPPPAPAASARASSSAACSAASRRAASSLTALIWGRGRGGGGGGPHRQAGRQA